MPASPFVIDSFEHGSLTSGVAGIYDAVATPGGDTNTPRTGLRCLEINVAAATKSVSYTVADTIVTMAFYIRFVTALPGANCNLARWLSVNGNGLFMFNFATTKFRISAGAGTAADVGPVITFNQWYRVVAEYDTSGATASLRCKIDNGTEVTATNAQTSANTTSCSLGTASANTYVARYDDWMIFVGTGMYDEVANRWTAHEVQSLIPSADGTHSIVTSGDFDSFTATAFSTSTTNGWTFVAHRPLQVTNTANQVIRQDVSGTTKYMEFVLEDLANTTGKEVVLGGVQSLASHIESSGTGTALSEMRLYLADLTTEVTRGGLAMIDTTDDPGLTLTLRKRMLDTPAGGWSVSVVNGCRVRLGYSDAAPVPNFIDCMLQVALFSAVSLLPRTSSMRRLIRR